jgi:hypothetical protein
MDIGRHLGFSGHVVKTVLKRANKIQCVIQPSALLSISKLTCTINFLTEKMERMLTT